MKKDDNIDGEELKKEIKEAIAPHIEKVNSHPLVKKYSIFTGLALGVIVVILFLNGSMIGIGGVETKDSHIDQLNGIGGGVETKSAQGTMNEGIGSSKVNTKDVAVSEEDAYAMQGQTYNNTQTIHTGVFNISTAAVTSDSGYYSQSGHTSTVYQASSGDVVSVTTSVLGSAMDATISWIYMLVLLMIVGISLSIIMAILFKVSRILGLG